MGLAFVVLVGVLKHIQRNHVAAICAAHTLMMMMKSSSVRYVDQYLCISISIMYDYI